MSASLRSAAQPLLEAAHQVRPFSPLLARRESATATATWLPNHRRLWRTRGLIMLKPHVRLTGDGWIISATCQNGARQQICLLRLDPTSQKQCLIPTVVHTRSPSTRAEGLGAGAPSRNALGTTCVSRESRLADARSILTLSSREARLPSYASLHIKPAKPCAPSARFQGVIVLTLATEMVREYLTEWRYFLRRHLRSKFAGT